MNSLIEGDTLSLPKGWGETALGNLCIKIGSGATQRGGSEKLKTKSEKYAEYQDIKGFCKSAEREEIEKHSYVLTPGRYVGIPDEEDDGIPFEDKMNELAATLTAQMQKEKMLDEQIKEQLAKIGVAL